MKLMLFVVCVLGEWNIPTYHERNRRVDAVDGQCPPNHPSTRVAYVPVRSICPCHEVQGAGPAAATASSLLCTTYPAPVLCASPARSAHPSAVAAAVLPSATPATTDCPAAAAAVWPAAATSK